MKNRVYTIVGKKGSGKSYTAGKIIDNYFSRSIKKYIVIIDQSDSYIRDKNLSWLSKMVIDRAIPGRSIDWRQMISNNQYVLFELRDLLEKEREPIINQIVGACYSLRDCLVVIDEAHTFVSKYSPPEEVVRLITGGRVARIDQIYICQRIQDLYLHCLSEADVLISFREQEVNAQKRLSQYLPGIRPEELGQLQPREFVMKDGELLSKLNTNTL